MNDILYIGCDMYAISARVNIVAHIKDIPKELRRLIKKNTLRADG